MPVEVELKLTATTDAPLLKLQTAERLGPAELGPPQTADELDRYLDTADGRFAAARWACRLRRRGERTIVSLKGPAEQPTGDARGSGVADRNGALHRRPEVEGPASDDLDPRWWPGSAGRDFVDRLRAGEPLVERLALRQQRTERAVLVDGERLATLSLDRVTVVHGEQELGKLHVVELELAPGAAERRLDEVAAALTAIDGLVADPATKLERALALLERTASSR
jgi:inorganic triphosphatase YgiF